MLCLRALIPPRQEQTHDSVHLPSASLRLCIHPPISNPVRPASSPIQPIPGYEYPPDSLAVENAGHSIAGRLRAHDSSPCHVSSRQRHRSIRTCPLILTHSAARSGRRVDRLELNACHPPRVRAQLRGRKGSTQELRCVAHRQCPTRKPEPLRFVPQRSRQRGQARPDLSANGYNCVQCCIASRSAC